MSCDWHPERRTVQKEEKKLKLQRSDLQPSERLAKSRHQGSPETHRASQRYGIEGCLGGPSSGPHYAERHGALDVVFLHSPERGFAGAWGISPATCCLFNNK